MTKVEGGGMQLDLLPQDVCPPLQKADAVPPKTPALQSESKRSMPEDMQTDDSDKAPGAFKTISEVAASLDVPQHVLRFWESRFPQIKPLKLRGGRRYYRPQDIEALQSIKHLLYKQGYTIKGARKIFGKKLPVYNPVPHARPPAKTKPAVSEKQASQLSVIRQELIGLKEVLKPYIG
jgi:DNA-binding transcriptional MerR regulator